ncbi:MAG: hypothetical protein QM767_29605 [Anaeromyxobacter sp.]
MGRARLLAALAAGVCIGCGGTEAGQAPDAAALSAGLNAQLAQVRRVTARYHDVAAALADGYVPASDCEQSPAGVMGIHYVNPSRLDLALDPLQPEVLLYVPWEGGLKLVAVEYVQPIVTAQGPYWGCGANDNSCPPADPPPAPTLFPGFPFNGPMAGHNPMMPWHYDQHVWIWAPNPSGMFAQWNPSLSCDG